MGNTWKRTDLRHLGVEQGHIYCFLSILIFRAVLDGNAEIASMKGNMLVGSLENGPENGMARTEPGAMFREGS